MQLAKRRLWPGTWLERFAEDEAVRDAGIARQHLESGEVIFFQGDLGDSVYLIQTGECDVLQETNGSERHTATLGPGDYFEEMALLNNLTLNATIRARTATDVLTVSKKDFEELKGSIPAFREVFQRLAQDRGELSKTKTATVQNVDLSSVQRESFNRSRQLLPLLIVHVCPLARFLTY